MRYITIPLQFNRYLLASWLICYGSLAGVTAWLPDGQWKSAVLLIIAITAAFTLWSRILLGWPRRSQSIELAVDRHGRVSVSIDNIHFTRWHFVWCTPRLVVLLIWCHSAYLFWFPLYALWFSPHNSGKEQHRNLRIVARFGTRLPVHYTDNKPPHPASQPHK